MSSDKTFSTPNISLMGWISKSFKFGAKQESTQDTDMVVEKKSKDNLLKKTQARQARVDNSSDGSDTCDSSPKTSLVVAKSGMVRKGKSSRISKSERAFSPVERPRGSPTDRAQTVNPRKRRDMRAVRQEQREASGDSDGVIMKASSTSEKASERKLATAFRRMSMKDTASGPSETDSNGEENVILENLTPPRRNRLRVDSVEEEERDTTLDVVDGNDDLDDVSEIDDIQIGVQTEQGRDRNAPRASSMVRDVSRDGSDGRKLRKSSSKSKLSARKDSDRGVGNVDKGRGGILGMDLASELGLEEGAIQRIEGRLGVALTQARYDFNAELTSEIKLQKEHSKKESDATLNAMQLSWEDKLHRTTNLWRDQITGLQEEMDELNLRYTTSLEKQKDLVTKGAQRAQESSVMRNELESLRREKEASLEETNAQIWLDTEYPEGYDEAQLSQLPKHLQEAGVRVYSRRLAVDEDRVRGEKGGAKAVPRPQVFKGKSQQKPYPPRYTEVVGEDGAEYLPSIRTEAELAQFLERDPEMERVHNSSQFSVKTRKERNGPRVTANTEAQEMSNTSTNFSLQNLGQAIVQMHSEQEKMFEKFALKLAAQNDVNRHEMEVTRAMITKEKKQLQQEDIDETVRYIDKCGGKGGRIIPESRLSRPGTEAVMSTSRGHYDLGADQTPDRLAEARHSPQVGYESHGGDVRATKPGYLPERIQIPKHEETEIGLFKGGVEARTIWPGFHANFVHLAKSYHWDRHVQGVLLARKCRDHALQVIKGLPEEKRQDYDALVKAFHKAYIPKEWARTYRGTLNSRKQKQGESLLKYAAALRELALTAFPCTEDENTDKVREERCLDQFMRGIRDPLLSMFVNNAHPDTMESAISAAEGYSAILAKDETDLPEHPDKRPVEMDTTLSALMMAAAADSKQPKTKPNGQKNFPRKEWKGRKGREQGRDSWVNNDPMKEKLIRGFEDKCNRKAKGGYNQNSNYNNPKTTYQARPQNDQRGYKKSADYKPDETVSRCYKCRRPGHIRRDCIFVSDECAIVEWYCEEHAPPQEYIEAEQDFH